MMISNRILIIAAHPDDEVLGCGGLLSQCKDKTNKEISVLFISEGNTCRFNKSDIESPSATQQIQKRNNNAKKALNFFKVKDYQFVNLTCGRLDTYPLIDITKVIEKKIKDFKPNTIFTHNHDDNNNDHKIVFDATLNATRPGVQNLVNSILSYEVLSSTEWNFIKSFQPNFFLELSNKNVLEKIKGMKFYLDEMRPYPFPRSDEGIRTLSSFRGMQSGKKLSEAYKIIRHIE